MKPTLPQSEVLGPLSPTRWVAFLLLAGGLRQCVLGSLALSLLPGLSPGGAGQGFIIWERGLSAVLCFAGEGSASPDLSHQADLCPKDSDLDGLL